VQGTSPEDAVRGADAELKKIYEGWGASAGPRRRLREHAVPTCPRPAAPVAAGRLLALAFRRAAGRCHRHRPGVRPGAAATCRGGRRAGARPPAPLAAQARAEGRESPLL